MNAKIAAALTLLLAVPLGCFSSSDGEGTSAKDAGKSLGAAVTDFASGVGKGVDEQLSVTVEAGPGMKEHGLSTTAAKSLGLDKEQPDQKGIDVYVIAEKAVKVKLTVKALNEAGQEIGRSSEVVELGADDAKYVTFLFDEKMDMQLTDRFIVDAKPAE